MVTIKAPKTSVCYQSSPVLKCLFEEVTDSAKWTMSNRTNSFELNNGSVVQLNQSCATNQYRSCTAVTLRMVPSIWEGRNKSLPIIRAEIRMTSDKHLNTSRCILETIFFSGLIHYGDHIGWWLLRATDIRWSESFCFYPGKEWLQNYNHFHMLRYLQYIKKAVGFTSACVWGCHVKGSVIHIPGAVAVCLYPRVLRRYVRVCVHNRVNRT